MSFLASTKTLVESLLMVIYFCKKFCKVTTLHSKWYRESWLCAVKVFVVVTRVGNGISFRTWNSFRYSAEESTHSEAFRGLRKSQFRSFEGNGMTWKKLNILNILLQQTDLTACFRPRHASEFREFAFIFVPRNVIPSWFLFRGMVWNRIPSVCFNFVPRNGIPSCFLFRGMVPNGIPRVCFYFCSTVQNFQHFSPLRNGSERNSESFPVPRNSRNSAGAN